MLTEWIEQHKLSESMIAFQCILCWPWSCSDHPALICKDKLAVYLHSNHIGFEIQRHRIAYTTQDVAASEHLPSQIMAKVVIVVADGEMVMLVLPVEYRVDLNKVGTALHVRELWLANEQDFTDRFPDCEIGAMPPFGNLYDLPVYVDTLLTSAKMIFFQAGTYTDTMSMAYADFERLVQPTVIDFAIHRQPKERFRKTSFGALKDF